MKWDILFNADYRYNVDRDLFVNQADKKAFSLEFVDDHSEEEIRRRMQESHNGNGWIFYFNEPPSDSVRQLLEEDLESVKG